METTRPGDSLPQPRHFRYAPEAAPEVSAPNGWREAAICARTVGELYALARRAQRDGEWTQNDAAWCALLRDKLGADERVTVLQLALLERELGARPVEVAS